MKVERNSDGSFIIDFESEQELREEHRTNLSFGALRLPMAEQIPLYTVLRIMLRGPGGGETTVEAKVVAALPDGVALAFEASADQMLARLLHVQEADESTEKNQTTWDRMRGLSQMAKILLAVKAERSERALLLQDSDARVLLSVLRNPRLTVDEVVRIAKSSSLTHQIADVIVKTTQWMANVDVRIALVHNPKTPPSFALRILPTLPEAEVRAIARTGTNMALKQAAVRKLQGKA